jgi:uncharacterized protein
VDFDMWKWNKKRKQQERLIAAQEEANRLEAEKLKVGKRNAELSAAVLAMLAEQKQKAHGYTIPTIPGFVTPPDKKPAIAMDSCAGIAAFANSDPQFYSSFPGYPKLAWMAQSSDYRSVPETTANEMTREWGEVKIKGDSNKDYADKISEIEQRIKVLGIRDLMRRHIETEMIFGRSQLFIDIKGHENQTDLPLLVNGTSLSKGCLKGFRLIEPIWSTPSMYNATDPTESDFFVPSKWFVLGKEIHADRLMTLIMRPVPDMLKPAYNFSGVSMLQLMQPYVERWQRTVDSVSDLIHSFSITGLKTNMENILLEGGQEGMAQLVMRSQMFSQLRNNQNLMLMDKDGEEFFQFNTPLSTLDNLMQKAQEQMAGPSHTPLVKLLGITPSGLNANSEGEIRVYNDYIASLQEAHLRPQIETILNLVQLDLFGEIDDQIVFEFSPLEQMNDEQKATIAKTKADADAVYVQAGVLAAEEIRERLAKDESGDYSGIDVEDVPESPDMELFNNASDKEEAANPT